MINPLSKNMNYFNFNPPIKIAPSWWSYKTFLYFQITDCKDVSKVLFFSVVLLYFSHCIAYRFLVYIFQPTTYLEIKGCKGRSEVVYALLESLVSLYQKSCPDCFLQFIMVTTHRVHKLAIHHNCHIIYT